MVRLDDAKQLADFLRSQGKFSVAVWDFDGVIVDTEPLHAASYQSLLKRRGIEPPPGFFVRWVGCPELEIWRALKDQHKFDDDIDVLIVERADEFRALEPDRLPPNWFVRPAAHLLSAAATTNVVLSSGYRELIVAYLERWNLRNIFDDISADAVAGPRGSKPLRLRRRLEAAARPLVLEDADRYLKISRELGAVTIGVEHDLNVDALYEVDALIPAHP